MNWRLITLQYCGGFAIISMNQSQAYTVVLICVFLMISGVHHLSLCLLVFCMSSVKRCLFRSYASFLIGFFFLWVVWVLYILWILTPYRNMICIYFPPFGRLVFSFCWWFPLLYRSTVDTVFDVISFGFWSQMQKKKKKVWRRMWKSWLPLFSSRRFMVSDFTFKSLVWFELTFVSDVRQ